MHYRFFCLLFLCGFLPALGQQASTGKATNNQHTLTTAPWQREEIAKGVWWQYHHFPDLFGSGQYVSVLDVDIRQKHIKLMVAYRDTLLLPTSILAKEAGALAAINGNYFHTEEGGSVCFLKVDGRILDTSRTDLTERLFLDQLDDAAFVLDAGNKPGLQRCPPAGWKSMQAFPTILSAGPVLVWNGKGIKPVPHSFNDSRYGRSGVGVTANNHLLFVTVDGNSSEAAGMTIPEFARLFQSLGCVQAINLDGGGSATMWIKGKPYKGVVNHPSDNKRFDHQGERAVANAIVITLDTR